MSTERDPLLGKVIDGYRIVKVIGQGGMGIVYEAEELALIRKVALKMIQPELLRDPLFTKRLRREGRALAQSDSNHIVRIHTLRDTAEGLFIVMEYVEGRTLKDVMSKGALPWRQAISIVNQLLEALAQAHAVGVVHRDIKPSNVMLTSEGVVKVMDFGLAKILIPDDLSTATDAVMGTLRYMSPEQFISPHAVDHRSDIFSTGMVLYEMLTGRLPFDRDMGYAPVMHAIVNEAFPSPSAFTGTLPANLVAAVMKALQKEATHRYQSASEMRAAIEAVSGDRTDRSSRRRVYIGGGSIAVLAAALLLVWQSGFFGDSEVDPPSSSDSSEQVIDSTTATPHVPIPSPSSYLPLAIGNQWVYRRTVAEGQKVFTFEAYRVDQEIRTVRAAFPDIVPGVSEETYLVKDEMERDGRTLWEISVSDPTARDGRYGLFTKPDKILWGDTTYSGNLAIEEFLISQSIFEGERIQRGFLLRNV